MSKVIEAEVVDVVTSHTTKPCERWAACGLRNNGQWFGPDYVGENEHEARYTTREWQCTFVLVRIALPSVEY